MMGTPFPPAGGPKCRSAGANATRRVALRMRVHLSLNFQRLTEYLDDVAPLCGEFDEFTFLHA